MRVDEERIDHLIMSNERELEAILLATTRLPFIGYLNLEQGT